MSLRVFGGCGEDNPRHGGLTGSVCLDAFMLGSVGRRTDGRQAVRIMFDRPVSPGWFSKDRHGDASISGWWMSYKSQMDVDVGMGGNCPLITMTV